jgi:CRISPR/Cas system Type II protein with McrA/HNH and RuvC-like nuclease domain
MKNTPVKTTMKGKNKMEAKNNELATAVEGIEEELGQYFGNLTHQQKKMLNDLTRLYDSLQGPEDALDHSGYSRPIPSANNRRKRPYSE